MYLVSSKFASLSRRCNALRIVVSNGNCSDIRRFWVCRVTCITAITGCAFHNSICPLRHNPTIRFPVPKMPTFPTLLPAIQFRDSDRPNRYLPPYSRHSRERSRSGLYSSPSPFLNLHLHPPRPTSYTYVSDPAKGKYPSSTPPIQSRTSPSIPSTRLHRHLNTSPTSVVGAARSLQR